MKINKDMYVRTKTGIAKITDIICGQDVKFDNDNIFEDDDLKQHHRYDGISANGYFFTHDVVKVSNNIIDLIEVGDYVNGFKVYEVDRVCCRITLNGGDVGNEFRLTYLRPALGKNMGIKTILTKEQYENNCYKVEE